MLVGFDRQWTKVESDSRRAIELDSRYSKVILSPCFYGCSFDCFKVSTNAALCMFVVKFILRFYDSCEDFFLHLCLKKPKMFFIIFYISLQKAVGNCPSKILKP